MITLLLRCVFAVTHRHQQALAYPVYYILQSSRGTWEVHEYYTWLIQDSIRDVFILVSYIKYEIVHNIYQRYSAPMMEIYF